jgi:hypothetical protein
MVTLPFSYETVLQVTKTGFCKASRYDDSTLDACTDTFLNHRQHEFCFYGYDCQIDLLGNLFNPFIKHISPDAASPGIDSKCPGLVTKSVLIIDNVGRMGLVGE